MTNYELAHYTYAINALGYVAALMILQLVVADVFGIKRKHVPGTPVDANHKDALFRLTRTVANTNESVAIFIAGLLYCVLTSASPTLTAYAAWTYACSRTVYAICYYANLQLLRSISFGVSLLALAWLLGVGLLA